MNAPANLSDAKFRASVVGASEVSALFDANPWLTRFELWHRKNGTVATPDFNAVGDDGKPENERIYFGVKLEPVIIEAACERWGYEPLPTASHFTNDNGLGGHPDRIVNCPQRGRGVLEVKCVDWLVVKQWGDEPPLHYLLQPQVYAGLAKADWCDVIALVGGNELRRFQYDFRPALFADIEARVSAFWQSVRDGKPPKADYRRDGATITDAIGAPNETVADLRHDNRAAHLAAMFREAKERAKLADSDADAAKAELLEKIGPAGMAMIKGFRVSCAMTAGSAGKLITDDMVGTITGVRKGYRRFDVKEYN